LPDHVAPPAAQEREAERWDDETFRRYLDEAAFLHTSRRALRLDPEIAWPELRATEQRLEAQLDALLTGGERAVHVCQRAVFAGEPVDPGVAYATARVMLRSERQDLFRRLIDQLDPEDGAGLEAISAAMRDGFPSAWHDPLLRQLTEGSAAWLPAAALLVGLRRLEATSSLTAGLNTASPANVPRIATALGRLRNYNAHDPLLECLSRQDDAAVRSAAAIALLGLGSPTAAQRCLQAAADQEWALLPLALAGGRKAVAVLRKRAEQRPHADAFLALGLLGDISAVNTLWSGLARDGLAPSAALGLYLLTGAPLHEPTPLETSPEPEPTRESGSIEDEHRDAAGAAQPEGARGHADRPPVSSAAVMRLSHNQADWQAWWQANRSAFRPDTRYRLGRIYAPSNLVAMLAADQTPNCLRQLVFEELFVRYNLNQPFDTELSVSAQRRVLADIDDWVRSYGDRFEPGKWYFAGQMISE
jgi:hypothetical protein